MISRISGKILEKHPPKVVIDVHGVGYELELPMSSFYDLPATGEQVCLRTHLWIREDAHLLFGFATEKERSTFRELIRISGIGAKVGLSTLSAMSVDEFIHAVRSKDISALTRIPGIGKKTAERIVLEMRDRLDKNLPAADSTLNTDGLPNEQNALSARSEALNALIILGYKAPEAEKMLAKVYQDTLTVEELIRQALKQSLKR